jgi:hypothetical protein
MVVLVGTFIQVCKCNDYSTNFNLFQLHFLNQHNNYHFLTYQFDIMFTLALLLIHCFLIILLCLLSYEVSFIYIRATNSSSGAQFNLHFHFYFHRFILCFYAYQNHLNSFLSSHYKCMGSPIVTFLIIYAFTVLPLFPIKSFSS